MTLTAKTTTSNGSHRPARAATAAARGIVYCAALLPFALATSVLVARGRAFLAPRMWHVLGVRVLAASTPVPQRPSTLAVLGHTMVSLLLGLAALVPLGIETLFLLRSVLYGLVDRGPYTSSWGGPTLLGAWAAHLLAGVPIALAGLLVLWGIARLHERMTLGLLSDRRSRGPLSASLAVVLAAGFLVVAWVRQLPS